MGFQRDLKDTVRDTKNFFKGYSKIQVKLRQATSIDPWGPAAIQMEEIARATHSPTLLADLIYTFDRRLNDHGKYWRHVYKSLVVMEYCIVCGSEAFVRYAKDTIYVIKTLKDFQYIDDKGRDQGAMIRQKSRDVVELLQNEAMLIEARRTKTIPRQQSRTSRSISPLSRNSNTTMQTKSTRNSSTRTANDEEMLRAIEESKRTAAEEARRRASTEDAFFSNLKSRENGQYVNGHSENSSFTIMHEQPKVILTHVPHAISVHGRSEKVGQMEEERQDRVDFSFMDDDPFADYNSPQSQTEVDPFANAEEVDVRNPFEDAEEVDMRPEAQSNTSKSQYTVPMPKNPYERSGHENDSVGMKPVKPMNLTPGFSTRGSSNIQHFN